MQKSILTFILLLITPTLALAAPTIEVQGLRVVKKGYSDRIKPFNWFPGTSVSLLVKNAAGGIISCDHNNSTLTTFKDDTGKDLLTSPPLSDFSTKGFQTSAWISDDTKAATVEIAAPALPSENAQKLLMEGTLKVRTATNKEVQTAKGVDLKAGTKFSVGPYNFEVKQVGKPQWSYNNAQYGVTFETKQELTKLESIEFLDGSGKKIESSTGTSSRTSINNNVTVTREFHMQSAPTGPVTVQASLWKDLKDHEVPFKMTATLGLSN